MLLQLVQVHMTDKGQSFRHGLGGRPYLTEPISICLQCDNYWFSKFTFMTNTLTDCITDAITVGSCSYDRHWSIHSVMGLVVDRTGPSQSLLVCSVIIICFQSLLS
jgi:hypothetical protein